LPKQYASQSGETAIHAWLHDENKGWQ